MTPVSEDRKVESVKTLFLGSQVVSSKQPKLVQIALGFPSWPTGSIEHHLNYSGKHSATLQLRHKDHSFVNIRLCVYLSELEQCRVNKTCTRFDIVADILTL